MEKTNGEAKVQKVKNWSPVWIFPIVTALIGAWILFYHYSHQGPEVTLITTNAGGLDVIVDGKQAPSLGKTGEILRGLPLEPAELTRVKRARSRINN